jgi:hypothetical protein
MIDDFRIQTGLGGAVVLRTIPTLGAKCAPKMGYPELWLV